jgi:hypothetical protein
MARPRPRLILLCAGAALTVCTGMVSAQAPDVGSTIANPAVLGRMFANVCISADTMDQADAALRSVGMLDNPETGTFFHQQFDLSLNPGGGTCSMVFVTDQAADAAMEIFRKTVEGTHAQEVADVALSVNETDGDIYVRAGIEVPW